MTSAAPSLSDPVRYVKGVGPVRERKLANLDVLTAEDLLFLFPRRYEDRRSLTPLSSLDPGTTASVIARVVALEKRRTAKRNLSLSTLLVTDGRSMVRAVWFNRKGLENIFIPGMRVALYGRVESRGGGVQLTSPDFEVLDEDDPDDGFLSIVPIYPTTAGLHQKTLRRIVRNALERYLPQLDDYLPEDVKNRHSFKDLAPCMMEMHYPTSRDAWKEARRRLVFDEFFLLQAGLALRRARGGIGSPAPSIARGRHVAEYLARLVPFELTPGQKVVLDEILSDMERTVPMNRLLQGDVGSGKTVVALVALLAAIDGGCQGALLAPTEILARQHYLNLRPVFESLGLPCSLLTGSTGAREKREAHAGLESGEIAAVIGTHALLSEGVSFSKLGLAIVDEQHRFGVLQKHSFRTKGESPHVLVMTATPIPRTLTLTVYGDLSVSRIPDMPPGRKGVATRVVPPSQLPGVIGFLKKRFAAGERAFWICPLIEESESDLAAATERFDHLSKELSGFGVGLVHGRLGMEEKERAMDDFTGGASSLLVATTVVEVGVDVPEATVMVIEDAERFGLSQLHQLRGRVGRGDREGCCILICSPKSPESYQRVRAFSSTSDGFEIAEADLRLRGPGEVCGVRQSGITDFRIADLRRDQELLLLARKEAFSLVDRDGALQGSPLLAQRVNHVLGRSLNLVETA
ncbi:MAG: ATP-dependent DNA helicase RecG [Synergistaceae bacterium]|nr:ATP-dependent DNA helicase RecG [Synergistota bacterium]NLM70685.1 ATP-dependent DNA helicase RecG [Synergistaceae bacterium]